MTSLPSSSAPALQRSAIPGSYGWPVLGPLSDRLQYFWFQGPSSFFEKRIEKYNSTVFRTNVPPAFPFFGGVNPNVVALLDVKSFSHLFDMDLVDKTETLVGDFRPDLKFTGGIRVLPFLDTTDPKHAQIKNFCLDMLMRSSKTWAPTMVAALDSTWDSIESKKGSTGSYLLPIQQSIFSFLSRSLIGADTTAVPEIHKSGHVMADKWIAFQYLPTISINRVQPLEELFIHSFSLPFWPIKSDYKKLEKFVEIQGKETLDRGQKDFGLTKEEALHNAISILAFSAYGGYVILFTQLLGNLATHKDVHAALRKEAREKIAENNGDLNFDAVRKMDLIKSFVYETLRFGPPIPSQFGRARKDFDLSSHDKVFEVKKGELLCGFQPVVMRDPKVFENPNEFVYDRFSCAKGGEELLKYLFWSNGPQSGTGPTAADKQCPAKDVVPLSGALLLAQLFQRYDEIEIKGSSITLKKVSSGSTDVKKAE
ncbi:hypothetical protein ABFS83_13G015800 [Erythranthe nasuta]